MPLPTQVLNCIACNVIVADSVLGEARTHLEFLGYAIEPAVDGFLISQPACYTWLLRDFRGGMLLRKAFTASDAGRAKPEAMLALANRINLDASFVRAFVDARGDLAIDAWYPNLYERRSFGLFITQLDRDLREQLARCREEVEVLLS